MSLEATTSGRCPCLETVPLYAVEALPEDEAEHMRVHLPMCAECRQELESLRAIVSSFGAWPAEILRPSDSLWGRLAERVGIDVASAVMPGSVPAWQEVQWEEVGAGISIKMLSEDSAHQRVSMLVRLAPGAAYPAHTHAGVEELHLLHGELWIDDRKLFPGDYNRGEPGGSDTRVWSETGCTCVLITSTRDVLWSWASSRP